MDKVRMNSADRELLEAVSAWWVGRLEEDPVIHGAMDKIENLSGEHSEEVSSFLYDIIGRAADMEAEATVKKLL